MTIIALSRGAGARAARVATRARGIGYRSGVSASPDSARPATRRALRERGRARSGADGDPGADAETPTDAVGADALAVALAPVEDAADTPVEDAPEAPDAVVADAANAPAEGAASDDPDALPATAFLLTSEPGPVVAPRPVASEPDPSTDFLADLESAPEQDSEDAAATEAPSAPAQWADERRPPTALTWLDPDAVAAASAAPVSENVAARDVFAGARLTPSWRRPRVLVPVGIVAALCGAYAATTLLWPLHAVAPEVSAVQVQAAAAPAAEVTWPTVGSAAVGVQGLSTVASATTPDEIASISKVASVLMVLDELPLKVGEQGPSFDFDYGDSRDYWQYRRSNQSALDVPVGGSLTEYQMLQGVMLGSANNYIDRLADELWGGRAGFAEAARTWLSDHGITGITLESPSGFDDRNVATPAALVTLGELAMKNPVFAEIVGTKSVEIPGAGTVTNTNGMLKDPGVLGIKTGTLSGWNLLTAKQVTVGDSDVRIFTSVLGQPDDDTRLAVTRSLLAEVEQQLIAQPATVPAGTVVGTVSTEWGATADVVTDADAQVVLWNGATATASTVFTLGDEMAKDATVGTLTAQGPLNSAETSVSLADEIKPPSIWWRLTHPLELFGLDKD